MTLDLPNPFDETEDTVRERFYATLDALYPNPALRPDLREGSLLDSLLAPAIAELARYYDKLNYTLRKGFIQTADGLYLDNKGLELDVARNAASGSTGILRFYGDAGTVIPPATTVSTVTEDPDADTYSFDTDTTVGGVPVPLALRTIIQTADPSARNQIYTITSTATGGAFRLTYNGTEGSSGTSLAYNCTAANVATHLATIPALVGNVTVTGGSLPTTPIVITLTGALASTVGATLAVTTSTLTGGTAVAAVTTIGTTAVPTLVVTPRNEQQTLAKTGTVTGGTYKLTYNGIELASALAWNATNATIQTALEGHASIGAGNIAVTGGPLPGNAVIFEFKNSLGKTDVGMITVTSSALTGGGSYGITLTQSGAPGDGTNITGNVKYKYTYVTPIGDPTNTEYDEGNGETTGSPVSTSVSLTDQSVVVTIPPVAVYTGLNEVKRVNVYRALDDGGGYSDYKYLGYVTADTTAAMTFEDNLSLVNFDSIEDIMPEDNTTGAVDLSATSTDVGAGTNAAPGTISLVEDLVNGVTEVTNRSAFTGGTDIETDDEYRTRLLDEIAKTPGAGNLEDYRTWAREVDGITNVSVVGEWMSQYTVPANLGPGTVKVIVSDEDNSPVSLAKMEEVRQYIAGDIAIVSPFELSSSIPAEVGTPVDGTSNVPAGTYKYVYTWVNVGGGETPHHAINPTTGAEDPTRLSATITVAAGDRVDLSGIAVGPTGDGPETTVKRRIYRKSISGGDANYVYVGEIADNSTTTYADRAAAPVATAKPAPTVNSTSAYNGRSPIGAHVTVETITEVTVTVNATIVPETGYNLAGTGGNIKLSTILATALDAVVRSVGAGETLYLSDIQNAIHDAEGVQDFRSVSLSQPTGCTLVNGNAVPGSSNLKIVFSGSGVLTEAIS